MPITAQPQLAVQLAFGERGELRAFHHQIGAAARHRQAEAARRTLQRVPETRADRMRHRDMSDAAGAEEAFLAREAAVDELVDDHEMSRRQFLFQAADRGEREDVGDAEALHRVDIGAVVQPARRDFMAAAVAGQKHHLHAFEHAAEKFIRRRSPRRFHLLPARLGEALDLVQAGAADNADDGGDLGHQIASRQIFRLVATARMVRNTRNSTTRSPTSRRSSRFGSDAQARKAATSEASCGKVAFVPSA